MTRLFGAILTIALCMFWTPGTAAQYYLMLGSRVASFDHMPLVTQNGRDYVTIAALDQLGLGRPLPTDAQDEQPQGHYDTDEGAGTDLVRIAEGDATTVSLIAPPVGEVGLPLPGRLRYRIAGHMLDVAQPGSLLAGEIDGIHVSNDQLFEYQGHRYIEAETLGKLGLPVVFNTTQDLYQLVGLIHTVDYEPERASILLRSLTPLDIEGVQVSDTEVTLVAQGGFLPPSETMEFGSGEPVTKLGFKSQPNLGRSFIFVRQPKRTGFKVVADSLVGYSRINFGNYFQVASYHKTSSGEISLNVQLGAASEAHHEIIADPWRLVIDFPGTTYEEATKVIPVNVGRVERIRVGTPEPGTVRVVMDLTERADYRILTHDKGARYFIQLLPPTELSTTPSQLRRGRTIMVDPGHGGSDPGAEGVLPGVWEAPIALSISSMLSAELQAMGYDVLETRTADRFTSLGARADYANYALPYMFVSVHANSIDNRPEMAGAMTFHHPYSVQGPQLAGSIQQQLVYATGAVDKGVRTADFFVLRETVVPSVLVECGFLTNRDECYMLTDPAYQRRIAQGIAQGIDNYITGGN